MRLFTTILCLLLTFHVLSIAQSEEDDFLIIKQRVIAELLKSPVDDAEVEILIQRMNEDGSFDGINYEDLGRIAGFPQRNRTRSQAEPDDSRETRDVRRGSAAARVNECWTFVQ